MMGKTKKRTFDEDLIKKAARLLKGETLTDEQKQAYNLHGRVKRKYRRLPIRFLNVRNRQWSIDLAEINDLSRYNYGYKYWLVCVDIYSRYIFVKLLKNKNANNVANKFEQILRESGEIPNKIQSDEGTEFQKIRNTLSKKYNFEVFHTYNREVKASHVERAIGTLKIMLRRVLTVTGENNYTHFLPAIIQKYNESPHRGLFGKKPVDVYFGKENIPLKKYVTKEIKNVTFVRNILKVGDVVRIARVKNNVFEKSSLQRWVKEKFKIAKVFISDPITYSLVDLEGEKIKGKFYREELQKA